MMELFQAKNIVKEFSNHLALDKVSISVPENSIFGLLGPNGAGKTTLIRIINQITAPDQGELFFEGRKMKPDDIYQIGYLPEERGLYKKMKVGEQSLYLAQLKGLSKHDALKQLKYWFEKFEMTEWWNKKVEELSKGMQQKVQFVTTILHQPKLLIFDEPFSGFDPINANLLKNEILELKRKGSTIIFSTHNMSSVEELCDRISLINKAEVILEGEIFDIKKNYRTNVYELSYTGDPLKLQYGIGNSYEILSNFTENHIHFASIKTQTEDSENRLLKALIPLVNIVSFNELIPSMNDVFIRVVEETNKTKSIA
jgi:ABC-2 type transport system ATP-binding protein